MNKLKTLAILSSILLLMASTSLLKVQAISTSNTTGFVRGEVIVGLSDLSTASLQTIGAKGGTVVKQIPALKALVVRVGDGKEDEFIQSVKSVSGFKYAERNGVYQAQFIPNDTNWPLQWNMPMIKANASWDTYRGSTEVVIAIIDTGIDYNHPDLAANYKSGGYDWVNNDFNPMDDNFHGTHCAGIAAAALNNALGVAGVAQVTLWAEKVLNNNGAGSWEAAANGIVHAADNGVNVISMSFGDTSYSNLTESACSYAWSKNVLLVAAAGNSQTNIDTTPFYPASFSTVIAVSATNNADNFDLGYSNYGNKIEVSAPGTSIYSTVPNATYGYATGTSMACPHVAGLAALILSYKPNLSNSQLRNALDTAVDDKGSPGKDIYYGYGRINCLKIVSSPEKYQYRFTLSGYSDRVWVNVTSQPGGTLINGKVNSTSPDVGYPAPVLGWASGDNFYMTFDYRTTPGYYALGFLVGKISTRAGNLYRTLDGTTWVGPTAVTLNPFAETSEGSEQQPNTATMVEPTAIQYVEGLNPTEPVEPGRTYNAQEFGIRYVPTVSYNLKKVELMAGQGTGLFTVQLRTDSGGNPSSTVLEQTTFIMTNTMSWQGAEFTTAYQVTAGTPYWIVLTPVPGSRTSTATSGVLVPHVWDYYSSGIGWDGIATSLFWMARFYREVQPTFTYHFTLSPFIDKTYVNVTSQAGGMLIYGLDNVTGSPLGYPASVLGWGAGNNFYMAIDFRTVIGYGGFELGFIVGTISTASGKLYRTLDGISFFGPTSVTLVPFAQNVDSKAKPANVAH